MLPGSRPMTTMRIAYLAHVNGAAESGVLAKIAAQAAHWRDRGHEVRVHLFTAADSALPVGRLGASQVERYRGARSRATAMGRLVAGIRATRPDLVYVRWDRFYPAMRHLPGIAPVAVEINTDDVAEFRARPRLTRLYHRLTRGLLLGRARLLVFVTGELAGGPAFAGFRARRGVVANGVDLAAYPELAAPVNPAPRLAMVGSPHQPWQGYDKVARLARLRPDWTFEMVGVAQRPGSPPNMTWHGPLDRTATLGVLARADAGIGTLALHRKRMDEACALKVREYLAVGLPVVYANHDPDVDGLAPLVLRLPNTPDNVETHVEAVDAWLAGVRGCRVPRSRVGHLDVAVKEDERLALLEQIALARG